MAVRTKQLASGRSTSATPAVVYTVPAGETAIVKSWNLFNINATTGTLVQILVDTATNNQTVYTEINMAARTRVAELAWLVLPPGAEIAISNSAAVGVNFWISGTELEGVAD
jgi:hypothetical protein